MPADIIGSTSSTWRQRVPLSPGAGVHRFAAGRRDQPDAAAHAGGAARGYGRAPGYRRRRAPRAVAALSRFATQNPVEFEGTYPLPEAELDRFAVKIKIGYPDEAGRAKQSWRGISEGLERRQAAESRVRLDPAPRTSPLPAPKSSRVGVNPALLGYIASLARRTREWPAIALGASPRAAIHLMQLAKADRRRPRDATTCCRTT